MSCEHLICAQCSGPVIEGRCAVCRASRAHVHQPSGLGLPPQVVAAILAVAVAVAALLYHLGH